MRITHELPSGLILAVGLMFGLSAAQTAGQPPSLPVRPAAPGDPAQYDRSPGTESPYETLEDAWRTALANDRALEASQWNVSASTRSLAAARAERFPSMTVGADYLVLSQEPAFSLPASTVLPSTLPFFQQDSGGVHALVTQPLYTSGRIAHGIGAAEANVQSNQAELGRTQLDVKMNVAERYIGVLKGGRLVSVAENKATSLAAHVRDAEQLYAKGVVAKTDVLAAQVALADARQQLLQARNGMEIARAAYNRALGRPLTAPVNLAELREEDGAEDVEGLTQEAIRCRPELAQLSAQARALREQAAATEAKKGPQVAVAGGYLYQQDRYIEPNGIAGVGVGVEWNLIDLGRSSHQSAALFQKAEALIRTRMDQESVVAFEVRQKWLDLQTALQRIGVAREATAQADENLRVVRQRYQQQTGTNTEVLDAETLDAQAYTNLYNSAYEALLARLRLRRAVGNL